MTTAAPGVALIAEEEQDGYHVDQQIGFVLRKASQRHVAIFTAHIADLTPPQFATLSKLSEVGETSQNQLGVLVAMDAATIKGVIDRLKARGLVAVAKHEADKRRLMVRLTDQGRTMIDGLTPLAERVSAETLSPLSPREAQQLTRLLSKIA